MTNSLVLPHCYLGIGRDDEVVVLLFCYSGIRWDDIAFMTVFSVILANARIHTHLSDNTSYNLVAFMFFHTENQNEKNRTDGGLA
jgi:hypothetical protein